MISHESKRILGTTSLLFIVALLVARALPSPGPSISAATPTPPTGNRLPPAMIFHENLSLSFRDQSFNLSVIGGHRYLWRFNVTYGAMTINLTSPVSNAVIWSGGPRSSGSQYLNGTGVASFNWTAPASGYYLLTFQRQRSSQWFSLSSVPLVSVCDAQVWDLNPLIVVFASSGLA